MHVHVLLQPELLEQVLRNPRLPKYLRELYQELDANNTGKHVYGFINQDAGGLRTYQVLE